MSDLSKDWMDREMDRMDRKSCKDVVNDEVVGYKEKERLILEAGSKIFSKKSFHEVKMQEIADEAGVGKGTIYEYFPSKEELLSEILKMSFNRYQAVINFENIEGQGLWERLENYLLANAKFFWDNKELGKLILRTDHPFQESLKKWLFEMRDNSINELEEVIIEAMENREIREISPNMAAKTVRGIINEFISATIIVEGKKLGRDDVKEAIELLKEGLKNT